MTAREAGERLRRLPKRRAFPRRMDVVFRWAGEQGEQRVRVRAVTPCEAWRQARAELGGRAIILRWEVPNTGRATVASFFNRQ